MADSPTAEFAALLARTNEPLPLDDALLLIAAHATPGLDRPAERERLDRLAAGITEGSLTGLRARLFDEVGFTGDRVTYYDPQNSMLPAVVERRMGIPITLAAVAMEVGRRCGVVLEGVAMPGHFLLRRPRDVDRYIDVFNGGRELDTAGCRDLFHQVQPGVPWSVDLLGTATPALMVERVLGNLAEAYRRSGNRHGLCWSLQLALYLPSATDRQRRELGVLLGASGRFDEGAAVLDGSRDERDHRAAARLRARLN